MTTIFSLFTADNIKTGLEIAGMLISAALVAWGTVVSIARRKEKDANSAIDILTKKQNEILALYKDDSETCRQELGRLDRNFKELREENFSLQKAVANLEVKMIKSGVDIPTTPPLPT